MSTRIVNVSGAFELDNSTFSCMSESGKIVHFVILSVSVQGLLVIESHS